MKIVEMQKEETDDITVSDIMSLINQCLKRDQGWKEFYESEMNGLVKEKEDDSNFYELLKTEADAEHFFLNFRYEEAAALYQQIIDSFTLDSHDKGWYLQKKAFCTYFFNASESQRIQKGAFGLNDELEKPMKGIAYKKMGSIDLNRTQNIITILQQFESFDDLIIEVHKICMQLDFGVEAKKFEAAMDDLGRMLGFESQRPDREFGKGPDNLWHTDDNTFILIECKSEVNDSRSEISKKETGQMNNHIGWFNEEYTDSNFSSIMIIPTERLADNANFTHEVRIMNKDKLDLLKEHFVNYMTEFKAYDLRTLNNSVIQESIKSNRFEHRDFLDLYSVAAKK